MKSLSTAVLLLKITCLAWFVAKIMSFKLWTSERLFPVIPTFDFLSFDNSIHLGLYFISIAGIVIIFFFPNKKIITSFIIVEILSCLLDQMRWQPWEYQYFLTLLFFLFARDKKQFLILFLLLIGCTYIFSGIHKFGGSFLYTFWDNTILRKLVQLDNDTIKNPIVHYFGLLPSFMEVIIGAGIIFFRNKKYFWLSALVMHFFILIIFGPLGTNHNSIIVPWNLAMILFAITFLYKKETLKLTIDFFGNRLNIFAFTLLGVLPILSFFGKWDHYLSFNLYSGNTKNLIICVENQRQYPDLVKYISVNISEKYCSSQYTINTNKWALDELKVPVIPEVRVYKKIKEEFAKKQPNQKNRFLYYQYPFKKENIIEIE